MRISIIILVFLTVCQQFALAQRQTPAKEGEVRNFKAPLKDSIPSDNLINTDTINIPIDIKYAQEPLESEIAYNADTILYNVVENTIYLYGNGLVQYDGFELKAGFIILDQENTLVTAEGRLDSIGNMASFPEFKDGEQDFKAKKIKYNYKTKKGLISEVTTQQNDLYIHSNTIKYEKGSDQEEHDHEKDDVIYGANCLFTTCNHPDHPHFGIRSRKQKIIANKVIVTGPANLEIAGVTTPLWIPFGFFPMTKGKRSGLIFPRDYENSPTLGFGIRNLGYYWAFNDNIDLQVTGEIFTRGTWRINSKMRYDKRYRYNGSLDVNYGWNYRQEVAGEIGRDVDKTLYVNWIYNQDKAANPNYNFKAKLNFQINNAQQINSNDFNNVLNNRLGSRVEFNKPFKGSKMNLNVAMVHDQVNSTGDFTIELPNIRFKANRFYPFKANVSTGKEKWYEKIGMTYDMDAITRVKTKDSLLFTPAVLDDVNYGIRHQVDMDAAFRVFKHFNLSPRIDYTESWFFETQDRAYSISETIQVDSIFDPANGEFIELDTTIINSSKVDTTFQTGFKPLRQLSASINLNTEVFSTLRFKKGWLQGLRYTMRPRIGFSYTPDYTDEGWGYTDTYQTDSREVAYSRFDGNIFNQRPSSQGLQMSMTYGIANIFEAKIRDSKDSTKQSKIVKLFDNMNFNGSYNFAADSLRFSPISGNATMRLFKGVSTITFGAIFDPYVIDEEGRRLNTTRWAAERKLLRFQSLTTRFRTSISWKNIQDWLGLTPNKNKAQDRNSNSQNGNIRGNNNQSVPTNYSDAFITNVSLGHTFNLRTTEDGTDITTNSLTLRGDINLSKKWNVTISQVGYDFNDKAFIYPQVSIGRDLHCWQMGMSWYPQREVYSFYLRVNPGSLDFISVPWGQNQFDSNFGGGRF